MSDNSMRGLQVVENNRTLRSKADDCLECSCSAQSDGIRFAPPETGVERIEAQFHGNGFAPHRHDTYAIGLTLGGVQTFSYRGETRFSMPGQIIVLHPDEVHDGGAGTDLGLRYRMIYIQPEQITQSCGRPGSGLPFVPTPVVEDSYFQRCLIDVFEDLDQEIGALKLDSFLSDLACGLKRHSDIPERGAVGDTLDWKAVTACREYLRENAEDAVSSVQLEAIANMDRFSLARQFRQAFGTSPHRYQVMRRLDRVKLAIVDGECLASAAATGGFADQSHMTRHFKRTYGMTPGNWQRLCSKGRLLS
ncbi:AraC family transcriptional regulator [Roseibium algae]|uniref:AraC family transcriptional regulator n=1 Tax=Roseibium algae TaxID=3123038 RepID=A0ABU8TJ19_9HYPH